MTKLDGLLSPGALAALLALAALSLLSIAARCRKLDSTGPPRLEADA